jgi:hypothetical protein
MNRVGVICLLIVCTGVANTARAQDPPLPRFDLKIECGAITGTNTSYQFGQFAWLEYIVETRRSINSCPIAVQTDAWVVGVDNSALTRAGLFSASARRQIPVPDYGRWQTNGKHWLIVGVLGWFEMGNTASHAVVVPPPEFDPQYECEVLQGGRWVGWSCELPNCPVIIDTARDGYRLTSVENGVRFDLNADGIPEQVAWTRRDADDAFLAMDRNGNGRIDDGSELFGNFTRAYADRPDITTPNGFEALKFTEGPSYGRSYPDREIDARDAVFSRLVLWRDRNHNGISEPDELEPVRDAGIVSIGTDYKRARKVDRYGNEFRQRATIRWRDGTDDAIFDVWLQWR